MRTKLIGLVLLAMGMFGSLSTPSAGQASASPFQSRLFVTDGVVAHVDTTHDRLIMNRDTGQPCLLDTSDAEITLLDGSRSGTTPDLTPGMRIHVTGRQISTGLVEVAHLQVLNPASPAPARPSESASPAAAGKDIELRGTVDTIDTRRGAFMVRVQDHTRTVYLADDTDLSGMALRDAGRFPVTRSERVTVWGRLQPDGGVLAGAVSKAITPPVNLPHPDRILFGRITATSNRLTSRDIRIRLTEGREVKVKVRRGLIIRRDGREISVHDLRGGDDVRTTGTFDGPDFQADSIDVLRGAEDSSGPAPTRGL